MDSTVCPDEGLDALADFCNKGEIVKRMYVYFLFSFLIFAEPVLITAFRTAQAMNGELDVTEALDQRLKVLNLTKDLMHQFLDKSPLKLTPGIEYIFNFII